MQQEHQSFCLMVGVMVLKLIILIVLPTPCQTFFLKLVIIKERVRISIDIKTITTACL